MKESTLLGLIAGTAIGVVIGSFLFSEEGKRFKEDVRTKVSRRLKDLENTMSGSEEDASDEPCNVSEEV